MLEFRFRALDSGGRIIEGTLTAKSRAEALNNLAIKRLQPIKLEEIQVLANHERNKQKNVQSKNTEYNTTSHQKVIEKQHSELSQKRTSSVPPSKHSPATSSSNRKQPQVTTDPKSTAHSQRKLWKNLQPLTSSQQLQFTTELVELLEAGLQLEQALAVMENREERSNIKNAAASVRAYVREGASFSRALAESNTGFSQLYLSVCSAGEASGALCKMLRSQADYLEFLQDLKRRLISALVYPSVVFTAGIVLLIVFMTFLLPQLTVLLSKTGQQLPLVTRLLVATSEWFVKWWWTIPIAILGISFLLRLWIKTETGKKTWDRFLLALPLLGEILKKQFLTQFLRSLATLTENGVNLLPALHLVQETFSNTVISKCTKKIAEDISEGIPLSRAMKKHPFFPLALLDIIRIGEQTGDISAALRRGAEKYDREFNVVIQRLATLIQPLSILLVALFVGMVAYAMITGILTTISGLRMR